MLRQVVHRAARTTFVTSTPDERRSGLRYDRARRNRRSGTKPKRPTDPGATLGATLRPSESQT